MADVDAGRDPAAHDDGDNSTDVVAPATGHADDEGHVAVADVDAGRDPAAHDDGDSNTDVSSRPPAVIGDAPLPDPGLISFSQVVQYPESFFEQYIKRREDDGITLSSYFIAPGVGGVALFERHANKKVVVDVEHSLEHAVFGVQTAYDAEIGGLAFSALELKDQFDMLSEYGMNLPRTMGLKRLYTLLTYFVGGIVDLGAMDMGQADDNAKARRFKDAIRHELDNIQAFYQGAVEKAQEGRYTRGIFLGFAITASLTVLAAAFLPSWLGGILNVSIGGPAFNAFLLTMLAGSLGAVLSVMLRMSRQKLNLRADVDPRRILILGMFRPAIGMLFGVAIYLLVLAGLLPLSRDPQTELALSGALGFLAGFSERWAQDLVTSTLETVPSPRAAAPQGISNTASVASAHLDPNTQ